MPQKQGRRPKLTVGFAQDSGLYGGDRGAESKAAFGGQHDYRFNRVHHRPQSVDESSRGLSPEAIAKISETLGAINTVGRYLVNYTKGAASPTDLFTHEDQQASPVSRLSTAWAGCGSVQLLCRMDVLIRKPSNLGIRAPYSNLRPRVDEKN